MLVAADAAHGRPVDVPVHGDGDAVADEQELEDGDVPSELAARDRARAEERVAERPERMAHAQVRKTGDAEPVGVLEGANRGDRARADDGVDGPVVQALGAQGDLQPRVLRVQCARRRGCRQARRERSRQEQPEAHGRPITA